MELTYLDIIVAGSLDNRMHADVNGVVWHYDVMFALSEIVKLPEMGCLSSPEAQMGFI